MILSIISGGQTGADLAGLRAALALGIPTGGFAPKNFLQEGLLTAPYLGTVYGLRETESTDWLERTEKNVRYSDATVIFGRRSPGSNRTEDYAYGLGKPYLWLPLPLDHKCRVLFHQWLSKNKPDILNVAGNRESTNPGIGDAVYDFLVEALAGEVK